METLASIPGDYQYVALKRGFVVQRFWHYTKFLLINKLLSPQAGNIVLDAGCGSGVVSDFLGKNGAQIVGIDNNAEAIVFAKTQFNKQNIEFIKCNLDEAQLWGKYAYDKIYFMEVIEHITPEIAELMLKLFHKHLAANGQVFITTPNYKSVWPFIEKVMDFFHLAPQLDGMQHVAKYDKSKLISLCEQCGYNVRIIASTNLFSPWIALVSWRLAEKMFNFEIDHNISTGPVLVAILEKKA